MQAGHGRFAIDAPPRIPAQLGHMNAQLEAQRSDSNHKYMARLQETREAALTQILPLPPFGTLYITSSQKTIAILGDRW